MNFEEVRDELDADVRQAGVGQLAGTPGSGSAFQRGNDQRTAMAEREKEIVVTTDGASRGATALAAVIAFVLLLILLAYVFRGELYGSDGGPADVKVNVQPG